MPLKRAILDARGNPIRSAVAAVPVRGRYDAAQSTDENARHWGEADVLSAKSANSHEVRAVLRRRSRYEYANNSYCRGIVTTLANDLIGTGPRLQSLTGNDTMDREIEAEFNLWSDAIHLPEKLRTMRQARAVDGESFALLTTNPMLQTDVQLDVRVYEADQIATPYPFPLDPLAVDGIRFDRFGNAIEYHLLKGHPGDDMRFAFGFEFTRIPADLMIHWFHQNRPQEYRGVPDITAALPLFAQLRRYTLAVLAAAETAADFAAVLYSELPPDSDPIDADPFETLEIERRMMTTLPAGWKMGQFDATQPTTTYEMFKHEILNEIARCLNMPFNIAAGNSSGYNYSSGRLDHQTYFRQLKVDQAHLERVALDRIFAAWLAEAGLMGIVPRDEEITHRWLWQGMEHVDPEKEAKATQVQIQTYLTTFSEECQKQGIDPESRATMIAADVAMFKRIGLPSPYEAKPGLASQPGQDQSTSTSDGGGDNANPSQDNQGNGQQNGRANGALTHRNGLFRP